MGPCLMRSESPGQLYRLSLTLPTTQGVFEPLYPRLTGENHVPVDKEEKVGYESAVEVAES